MAILVQEASDTDIPRACEMEAAAYANNAASPILFPGPFPPDHLEQRGNGLIADRKADPTIRYLKAVDEGTGEQVSFAKWHIYDTAAAAASVELPSKPRWGPGMNKEACEDFFGGIAKRRIAIMGSKPYMYLHLLHTDPKHQGKGAGGALVKWGLETADNLGLPIYLESSPDGHTFYQSHGFKDIEEFPLNLSKYGGTNTVHITPLMIRDSQPK